MAVDRLGERGVRPEDPAALRHPLHGDGPRRTEGRGRLQPQGGLQLVLRHAGAAPRVRHPRWTLALAQAQPGHRPGLQPAGGRPGEVPLAAGWPRGHLLAHHGGHPARARRPRGGGAPGQGPRPEPADRGHGEDRQAAPAGHRARAGRRHHPPRQGGPAHPRPGDPPPVPDLRTGAARGRLGVPRRLRLPVRAADPREQQPPRRRLAEVPAPGGARGEDRLGPRREPRALRRAAQPLHRGARELPARDDLRRLHRLRGDRRLRADRAAGEGPAPHRRPEARVRARARRGAPRVEGGRRAPGALHQRRPAGRPALAARSGRDGALPRQPAHGAGRSRGTAGHDRARAGRDAQPPGHPSGEGARAARRQGHRALPPGHHRPGDRDQVPLAADPACDGADHRPRRAHQARGDLGHRLGHPGLGRDRRPRRGALALRRRRRGEVARQDGRRRPGARPRAGLDRRAGQERGATRAGPGRRAAVRAGRRVPRRRHRRHPGRLVRRLRALGLRGRGRLGREASGVDGLRHRRARHLPAG